MEDTQTKKQSLTKRISAFFDRNFSLFFAPVLVAFLYILALAQNDVYPFGDKYTAASYDLSAQIAPFIEHLFDVFDGKSTLTFSYAIVGGADVTGTFLYFFVSPFSFLFLIFGDGKVAHASSIVMICKLVTIAFTGTWFARTLFKNIPEYLCVAVGVLYAYCGYTFVSNTYINWMDFLIYLPFAAWAFQRFVKTGKYLAFSILVACCIYTCFSIACFSLFTVLPALVIYGLLCVEKEKKHKFIAYLCLSFLVAILLSLPILLPALGAYSVSGRGGELFENFWKGFTLNEAGIPENFNASTYQTSYMQSVYRKLSYILSDSIFVILTCVWFFRNGLKDKLAQFMLIAGALTLLPVFVDESMNLLNMGSYMSYALRFGFLNALYFLGGACLCLEEICFKPFCAYDGEKIFNGVEKTITAPENAVEGEERTEREKVPEKRKKEGRYALKAFLDRKNLKNTLFSVGFILLGALVAIFLCWFISGENYKAFLKAFGIESKTFSGSYAHSLGGLEVIVVLFVAVAVAAIIGSFFVSCKWISPRLTATVLAVILVGQVVFYNTHLVVGNRSTQHEGLATYTKLYERIDEWEEESYYRVADYNNSYTACAPFTVGANAFSVFSSVIDANNFVTLQLFGFDGNGKNSFKSGHSPTRYNRCDEFGYSFLGYKYIVSNNKARTYTTNGKTEKEDQTVKDLKGLKAVTERDSNGQAVVKDGKETQLAVNGLYAYENENVFPLGYRVKSGRFTFEADNISNSANRRKNQKQLYEYLAGTESEDSSISPEEVATLATSLRQRAAIVEVGAGEIQATVTAEAGEDLLLSFVAVKGYSVTVNGNEAELIDNDLKFLQVALESGENVVVFTYRSPYVKYAGYGVLAAIVMLAAVALVVKKTAFMEKAAALISWAGIAVTAVVVGFFMLYPTGAFLAKLVEWLKLIL